MNAPAKLPGHVEVHETVLKHVYENVGEALTEALDIASGWGPSEPQDWLRIIKLLHQAKRELEAEGFSEGVNVLRALTQDSAQP